MITVYYGNVIEAIISSNHARLGRHSFENRDLREMSSVIKVAVCSLKIPTIQRLSSTGVLTGGVFI